MMRFIIYFFNLCKIIISLNQSTNKSDFNSIISNIKWDFINLLNSNSNLKTVIQESDIKRAKENSLKHKWGKNIEKSIIKNGENNIKELTEEYINKMISTITPGTTSICPNCIKKGLHWHSNGYWSWNAKEPDKIKCNVCGMVFPNKEYPETIKRVSQWNNTQVITYVDMKPQICMGYIGCKASINAVIRSKKLYYIIRKLENLGLSYQLTKNITYANTIKKVFNRLASVLPYYLVYEGYSYGEYADCDPKYVALNIKNLTKDPNKNCRLLKATGIENNPKELYTGYWSASRLGTSGMDGSFVSMISKAYDLIKETFTSQEKKYYEKNILEEITYLAIGDTNINNKAVYNIKGCALAGLASDNINLIRFGLNGYLKAINEWFLKDGGTCESVAYSIMTLSGIFELGFAFRNYSDPINYIPPKGEKKYVNFNSMIHTPLYESFQSLIWTSYGNFYYPSIADSYNTTVIQNDFIEFINFANPIEKEYLNEQLKKIKPNSLSFFFRNPNQGNFTESKFTHPDIIFPYLSQGFLRTGDYGEKSLLILDASNYGNHHHKDSLNIVFWKEGHELLIDLGYLWDHVNSSKIKHTYNHHTVYVNDDDQITKNRNGSFSTFFNSSKFKIMQAASNAYIDCDIYNRTIIQIEHIDNSSYFIDIFRVHGGQSRQYVFHGPNNNYSINSDLQFNQTDVFSNIHFALQLKINTYDGTLGYIEIKDVILTEGKNTKNLLSPFPKNYPQKGCPSEGTWCHYLGDGKVKIEVNNSFKLTAIEAGKKNVNMGISIGNSNGYIGPNSFNKRISQTFNLKFKLKGTINPNLNLLYWNNDKYNDTNARKYQTIANIKNISSNYQEYSFDFYLVKEPYKKKFGITQKEWNVKWNTNENYTFNAYFPKRKNQKVYFEKGWGQRDYRDKDYGVTLPYFYIDGSFDYNNYSTFVVIYEAHNKSIENLVKSFEIDDQLNGNIGIKVNTKDGEDYILSVTDNNNISSFGLNTDATVSIKVIDNYKVSKVCIGGTFCDDIKFNQKEFNGFTKSFSNDNNNSYFEIETKMKKNNIIGQSLQIIGSDNIMRTYPIFKVEEIKKGLKIFTRFNHRGFRVYENVYWRIQNVKIKNTIKLTGFQIFLIIIGSIILVIIILYLLYYCYTNKKIKDLNYYDFSMKLY